MFPPSKKPAPGGPPPGADPFGPAPAGGPAMPLAMDPFGGVAQPPLGMTPGMPKPG